MSAWCCNLGGFISPRGDDSTRDFPFWLNTKMTTLGGFLIPEFVFQTKQKQSKKSQEGGED